METKNEKFIRVAENRTNKIIDMVRLLGNCSNKITYDYSDVQVKAIFSAIETELKNSKSKFQWTDATENKFKLR